MSSEILNKKRVEETLRVEPSSSPFGMQLRLIRDPRFRADVAWLEATKVLDYVSNKDESGNLPYDLEVAKEFFLLAKLAHRVTTLSGHEQIHLDRYKRARTEKINQLDEAEVPTYQRLVRFMEKELIDGKLRLL